METKAVHLFNLAHYKPFNPILGQHAVSADIHAFENALVYPPHFSHCPQCGTLRLCGLTSSYYIKYTKRLKDPKKNKNESASNTSIDNSNIKCRDRHLTIKCLHCHHVEKTPLLNKKEKHIVQKLDTKRRKKKSELLAMLDRKRQLENSLRPTLDLMSFMQ